MSATVLPRANRVALDPAVAVVAGATLLALALRLAASGGDAGLDEVWSMRLVERVDGLGGVFWGISHDNNHFLNSSWLYWLGPDAPVWAWRLPAVALGTLTVPALARLCGRRDPAAGTIAALFGAVVPPLVDFGSEARGYAGLVLATVVALDAAGRIAGAALERQRDGRAAWRLGLAVGLGLLCHLAMAFTVAVVGLALVIRIGLRRPALREAASALIPSALLAVPAVGCVLAGLANRGGFTVGDVDPFSLGKLVSGLGDMLLLAAGLPDTLPAALGVAGALALLAVAARARLAPSWTLAVAVAALVALPLAMAALRLPNVVYARYYAVSGVALLMLLAETLARPWGEARNRRAAAMAVLAILAGSLAIDAVAIRDGRDASTATLRVIAADDPRPGAPTVAADSPAMAALLLGEAARRAGTAAPILVPVADLCGSPAAWYMAVGTLDRRPGAAVEVGPEACRTRFVLHRVFSASPLSGTGWTLYRRG